MASSKTKIQKLFEFCINGDRIGLADYIITNKCNPSSYDAQDSNRQTALHIACQYGHLFVVRSLIEIFGCSPQIRDVLGNLPVHYACQHGHLPIVDYLLHFKDISITQAVFEIDSEGSNLLHKACQSGSAPVVRYLQEILCYNSKISILRKLNLYLDSIAPYDMSLPQKKPTHETRVIVNALLAENKRGDTPLHVACRYDHSAIIKIFKSYLPFMPQLNLALTATRCNHIDLAEYIQKVNVCELFVDVDSESLFGMEGFGTNDPFHTGVFKQYKSLIAIDKHCLVCPNCKKSCVSPTLSKIVCKDCKVKLNLQAINSKNIKEISVFKEFQDYNVAFSPPYPSCLQAITLSGNEQAFKKITGNMQSTALILTNVARNIPSRLQAAAITSKIVKDEQFLPFDSGTLHSACVSDDIELVKHIMESLNCGPNVLDSHGNTPLHIACEWGSQSVFKLLINLKDLKKDVVNKSANTPLLLACKHGCYELCEPLLDCTSVVPNQETPLHVIAASNHVTVEVLSKFVNPSSVVNSVDQYEDTPIFNACRSGNLAVVKFLIEKGSDPLFINHLTKETPVHIACRMARPDILETLLKKSPTTTKFGANSCTTTPI